MFGQPRQSLCQRQGAQVETICKWICLSIALWSVSCGSQSIVSDSSSIPSTSLDSATDGAIQPEPSVNPVSILETCNRSVADTFQRPYRAGKTSTTKQKTSSQTMLPPQLSSLEEIPASPSCKCPVTPIKMNSNEHLTPEGILVDDFGAKGDGVTWDDVAIQSAIDIAGEGGTLLFSEGKIYNVCRPLISKPSQYWTTKGVIPATIRRCNGAKLVLAKTAELGDKVLSVETPGTLKPGQWVTVAKAPPNTRDDGDTQINTVVSVTGNQVTLTNGVQATYEAGSILTLNFPLVLLTGKGTHVSWLNFDGNRLKNNYYLGWERPQSMNLYKADGAVIEHCTFREAQGDHIFVNSADVHIRYNLFETANGAALHLSSANRAEIHHNVIRSTNLQAERIGHAEAAITWSNANVWPHLYENCIENVPAFAFGRIVTTAGGNRGTLIENNVVCRTQGILDAKGGTKANYPKEGMDLELEFRDNYTVDSGMVRIFQQEGNLRGVVVDRNKIYNGYLHLVGTDNVEVTNNFIAMNDAETYGDPDKYDRNPGLLGIYQGHDICVARNQIIGGNKGVFVFAGDSSSNRKRNVVLEDNEILHQRTTGIMLGNRSVSWSETPGTWQTEAADLKEIYLRRNVIILDQLIDPSDAHQAAVHLGRGMTGEGPVFEQNCVRTNKHALFVEGRSEDVGHSVLYVRNNWLMSALSPANYWAIDGKRYHHNLEIIGNKTTQPFNEHMKDEDSNRFEDNEIDETIDCVRSN